MTHAELVIVVKAIAPVVREYLGALTDRVVELETLAKGDRGESGPVGPQGLQGIPGRDGMTVYGPPGEKGTNGSNGQDGLGFDDLAVLHDGERGVTFRFMRGDKIKEFGIQIPALIYRGVFTDGKTYELGDVTTWGGSTWHCQKATISKPGDGATDWQLVTKRGRDGRDGQDAPGALPVVKVR